MASISDQIKKHYLEFGIFTYPGLYEDVLKSLPDNIREIGLLVRKSVIHRTTLVAGNTSTNADLRFGDMKKVPWWRQTEEDILQTTGAMLTELLRRDQNGFTPSRAPEDKLVLTCRYVCILMASILKSKGIPARVRAGHAPYFDMGDLGDISTDHWINQYWNEAESRWVTIDVDGSLSLKDNVFDPYDILDGTFDFAADAWLSVRSGKVDENHFYNAGGVWGLNTVLWSLAYDFHSLMNSEIIYNHGFAFGEPEKFKQLTEAELEKIDQLAELMQDPDGNFEKLKHIWDAEKQFRLLVGSLL
jgi:hypothetical protein